MFSDFILWLRGKHTIESIIKPVGPVIHHLNKHEMRHAGKVVGHSASAERHLTRAEQSRGQRDRAKNVAAKLAKLVE